jgi:fatty acid desaturase
MPTVKYAEVMKHNTEDDLWIVIKDKVYEINAFLHHHPGGWLPLLNMGGKDSTDPFIQYHPAEVWKKLPSYHVANLDPKEAAESKFVKEHRALRDKFIEMGWFDTTYTYYLLMGLRIASILATALYLTIWCESRTAHMMGALAMGAYWQQLAFVGHDLGHSGITHNFKQDNILGIIFGNFFGGISIAWWKRSHNVHHIVCNSVEHDPDIQHMPVFAVDSSIFNGYFSTFHAREMVFDPLCRFLVAYQHFLYYPIMGLARFNLYAQSWILLLSSQKVHFKTLEIIALLGFNAWYLYVLSYIPTWGQWWAYLIISHFVSGLLHVQITLSHFPLEIFSGHPYTPGNENDEWWHLQLRTTMDIDCSPWMDWFHGGLQFQIEHHLFPRIPRHNLRKVMPYVKELSKKHNIPYHAPNFM